MGALGGSARRAKPAPDSPQEDVVDPLMSRGRPFKQTATADAIPFSTSTPVCTELNGIRITPKSHRRSHTLLN